MATICCEQNISTINVKLDSASVSKSHQVSVPGLLSAYGHRVLQWVARRREQRESREAFAHLLKLDDTLLRDIGVTRSEVERAARLPLAEDAARALRDATGRNAQ